MLYDDEAKYKEAIYDYHISNKSIMQDLTIPKTIFKYRSFGKQTAEGVDDSNTFWRESLDGAFHFTNPAEFNRNDPDDCKLILQDEAIPSLINLLPNEYLKKKYPNQFTEVLTRIKDTKDTFRERLRIGCFTTCDVDHQDMWKKDIFGGNDSGYCIEYEVSEQLFYPGTILFLKVLYDDHLYDATMSIANSIKGEILARKEKYRAPNRLNAYQIAGICTAHNPALIKLNNGYEQEQEWRIIIICNRFDDYFGKGNNCFNRDFSSAMKAVYLGADYKSLDPTGEKLEYAYMTCDKLKIPLYYMHESQGTYTKECLYQPII